jgi:hypothetical protein
LYKTRAIGRETAISLENKAAKNDMSEKIKSQSFLLPVFSSDLINNIKEPIENKKASKSSR